MGVDLAIISLLNTEHEVDAATLQNILLNAEIPGGHLEAVKDIGGDFVGGDLLVHDVTHVFHLELLVAI